MSSFLGASFLFFYDPRSFGEFAASARAGLLERALLKDEASLQYLLLSYSAAVYTEYGFSYSLEEVGELLQPVLSEIKLENLYKTISVQGNTALLRAMDFARALCATTVVIAEREAVSPKITRVHVEEAWQAFKRWCPFPLHGVC